MIGSKVPGQGPIPCKLAIIGEGPGKTEAEEGRPFCGASGTELDWLYLRRAAGIKRENVYVSNVVKYRTDLKDSDPTEEDIKRDEAELEAEILVVDPDIIVAVGRVAACWFMQTQELDLEKLHGVPIQCPRYPSKTLLIVYHPAAGLHQPERYSALIYWDFEQLGRLLRGEIKPLSDTIVQPRYVDAGPELALPKVNTIAMDTEGSTDKPWGLSLSYFEGEAFVLRGSQGPATQTVQGAVSVARDVVLHNALYDLPVLEKLGISVRPEQLQDTMLAAYLVPWLPRRLKALSYKLCGMEQDEYEDITKEADERIGKEYFLKALENKCQKCGGSGNVRVPYKRQPNKFKSVKCEQCKGDGTGWPQPAPQLLFDSDSSGRVYKPRSVGRALGEILKRGANFRAGWNALDVQVRHDVESELGPINETTLDDVPLDKAVHYSARDADATLRVWHILEPLLKREGLWNVYQIDKGIIPIIDRMHRNGILIDRKHFDALESQFTRERAGIVDRLSDIAGFSFNPSSPLQVSQLLYEKFNLKAARGQQSTDEKTLEALKIRYASREEVTEAIDLITDARELGKLLGTYVIPLPPAADIHDRVHTRFLLHVTNTGRLASRDPNCFSGDTEVLTPAGWVTFDSLRDEAVAQWDDGVITFVAPTGYIKSVQRTLRIFSQHIDLLVTPEHRCLVLNRKTGQQKVVEAQEYPSSFKQLNAGVFIGAGFDISDDMLRLLLAVQADGHWSHGGDAVDFVFAKPRKIARLRELLTRLGLTFRESDKSGERRFYVNAGQLQHVRQLLGQSKLFDWDMILSLSPHQAELVMEEVMFWDGCWTRRNHYASINKQNADAIATLFTLNGKRAVVRKYVNSKGSVSWQVDVTNRDYTLTANHKKAYEGIATVYCVSVPSSYLLVRRNGKVMITGNCQNIPTRTERGRLIRKGFVPPEGCSLVSVDLDQIELRVAAHLSGDENMIDVFQTGKDIHRATAALIYGKPQEEITTQERLLSKTINFLILYGGSANRLQKELSLLGINVTKEQCVGFINGWFKAYPGVKDFMAKCEAQARDFGYVECMFGRRRYLPGVHSGIDRVREESLRWATNFPVQATAAGILKLWLNGLYRNVIPAVARLGYCEALLTVHDEVIFEVSKGLEELLIGLTVQEAANCIDLLVPVGAKGAFANDWGGLK